MPFIMYQTDFQVGTKSFQVLFRHSRRVFTSGLRKSVRVFVIKIFLIIKNASQVEIWAISCPNDSKSRNGTLRVKNQTGISWDSACAFGPHLGNRSAFILIGFTLVNLRETLSQQRQHYIRFSFYINAMIVLVTKLISTLSMTAIFVRLSIQGIELTLSLKAFRTSMIISSA